VAYAYDRFGRVLQDGDLRYRHDPNGNRTEVEYPGGVIAQYAFDALDRPESLNLSTGGSVQAVATSATYYPGGPLAGLTLGNGLVETRSHDARYFPTAIQLGGKLHWNYTTDREGNILQIADALNAAQTKTYGYQDYQYYLTTGNGPWGALSWSYDPLGNRLTETRDGATDQYTYQLNATGGRTAKLVEVAPPADTATQILYDAIGSQAYESTGPDKVIRSFDAAGRMSQEIRGADPAGSPMSRFVYDGRSYLRRAEYLPTAARGEVTRETTAVYSSEGVLHQRMVETRVGVEDERGFVGNTERVSILYFGSRPVGQFEQDGDGERLRFLTVDHLGTPVAITEGAGGLGWAGGFEPFGADYGGAGEGGVFLRFPGQWFDRVWEAARLRAEEYYNVHRWYSHNEGRYIRVDPLSRFLVPSPSSQKNSYLYVGASPIGNLDPLGLVKVKCEGCREVGRAIRNARERIHLLQSTGSAVNPNRGASNRPAAVTNCASFRLADGTVVGTEADTSRAGDLSFPKDPCVFLCVGVHERVHRQMCKNFGGDLYNRLPESVVELPAYTEELKCLRSAKDRGSLELEFRQVRY
jgi:RHS repeat-associated protein